MLSSYSVCRTNAMNYDEKSSHTPWQYQAHQTEGTEHTNTTGNYVKSCKLRTWSIYLEHVGKGVPSKDTLMDPEGAFEVRTKSCLVLSSHLGLCSSVVHVCSQPFLCCDFIFRGQCAFSKARKCYHVSGCYWWAAVPSILKHSLRLGRSKQCSGARRPQCSDHLQVL